MHSVRMMNKVLSSISKNNQILAVNFSCIPNIKPESPNFGSGPCKKRPGWKTSVLNNSAVGRSHRSDLGKNKLKKAIDYQKKY